MSSESRTMIVVLVVCGMLALGCLGVPAAIGAFMYFRLERDAQQMRAEANRAVAETQQAVAVQQAMAAQEQARILKSQPGLPPILAAPPALPPGLVLPPGVEVAPPSIPGLPAVPGQISLADPQQRRLVYQALKAQRDLAKQLQDSFAQLKDSGLDDPNITQALSQMQVEQDKALDRTCKLYGITRERLTEILAEGDKAGW